MIFKSHHNCENNTEKIKLDMEILATCALSPWANRLKKKTAPPFPRRCLVYVNDDGLQTSRVIFETAPLNCQSGRTRTLRWAKVSRDGAMK